MDISEYLFSLEPDTGTDKYSVAARIIHIGKVHERIRNITECAKICLELKTATTFYQLKTRNIPKSWYSKIASKYNVNEKWLRTGQGAIYQNTPEGNQKLPPVAAKPDTYSTPIHLNRNGSEPKPNILSQKDFDNLSESTMKTLFQFIRGAYYPGRTQSRFAQELGVTKNTLQGLLTGKTRQTDTVTKIHGALNANPGVPADIVTLFYKALDKPIQHDQKAYPVAGHNETPDTADEHHAAYSCPGHTYEKYCKHRFNAIEHRFDTLEKALQELLLQKKHDNTEEHSSPDNSGRKTG